jgi:hypothetical protein
MISVNKFSNANFQTQITIAALVLMKRDFIATEKCDLTLAKEQESAPSLAWVLPKHSPLREDVTKGFALRTNH